MRASDQNFNSTENTLFGLVEDGSQDSLVVLEELFETNGKDITKQALNQALHLLCSSYKTSGCYVDMLNLLLK